MSKLYQLPDGWEWKKFDDLFTITSSKRVHKKDWLSNGIPFYRAREIVKLSKNGFVDNELFISNEMYNSFIEKYGIPKENDILVTGVGTLGIPYVVKSNDKFYFKDGNIIWFKNENNTNSKYIEYGFQSEFIKNQINSNSGSTVGTYTITNANNTIIPLPPLEEQKRIVSKLDSLFEKIDNSISLHQKNIDEANIFMASVLNDVFSELEERYPKIIFDKVCKKITDGSHNPPKGIDSSQFMMLSSKNVFNNSINFDNPRYLKEEDFNRENKRTDIRIEDVLLTIVGTIGRTAVVNIEEKFTLQRSVAVLKPKKDLLDSYFLMYSLQKNLENLTDEAKGSAQKGIYLNSVKQLKIVDVSLSTQQKVVAYLDEISQKMDKIKQIQKEKMQSLKALKTSILDKAFRGEL